MHLLIALTIVILSLYGLGALPATASHLYRGLDAAATLTAGSRQRSLQRMLPPPWGWPSRETRAQPALALVHSPQAPVEIVDLLIDLCCYTAILLSQAQCRALL